MQSFGTFYILIALPAINDCLERIVVVPEDVLKFQLDQSFDLDMENGSFFILNLTKHTIDCHLIDFPYLTEMSL